MPPCRPAPNRLLASRHLPGAGLRGTGKRLVLLVLALCLSLFVFLFPAPLFFSLPNRSLPVISRTEFLIICFSSYILKVFSQLLGTMTGGLEPRSLALSQNEFRAESTIKSEGSPSFSFPFLPPVPPFHSVDSYNMSPPCWSLNSTETWYPHSIPLFT